MIKQIINLLTFRLKIHLLFLVFFMFVKGVAELISISSIPFLILYLLNPNKIVNFFDQNNLDVLSEFVTSLNLTSVLVIVFFVFFIRSHFCSSFLAKQPNDAFGLCSRWYTEACFLCEHAKASKKI